MACITLVVVVTSNMRTLATTVAALYSRVAIRSLNTDFGSATGIRKRIELTPLSRSIRLSLKIGNLQRSSENSKED